MRRSDDLQITLALQGDLERWAQAAKLAILEGLRSSAIHVADDGLELLRNDVRGAGLGDGVANAWRMKVQPRSRLAYSPAVFFHSNAPHIIDAFTRAEPIQGKPLLLIPIPGSPADTIRIRRGQKRAVEIEKRYGPLRAINLKGGGVMLVARGRASVDGAGFRPLARRKAGASGSFTPINQKNQVDIPMFWLVPNVRLSKRLNWPEIAERIQSAYAREVETELRQRLARTGSALLGAGHSSGLADSADAALLQQADQMASRRLGASQEIDW